LAALGAGTVPGSVATGTYADAVADGNRVDRQYRAMLRRALDDLLDQLRPFGRLALVQACMVAGTTLVAVSLAGSLFFSISPDEAKSKVFLYLVLTLAPFAVISPLLGPLIDRSRGARRAMVVTAAVVAALLCPFMARDVHSLLLFPEAFVMLVLSNVYLVTRNALVPEMVVAEGGGRAGAPEDHDGPQSGFASLNARLTLLGTLAGFAAAIPGLILLKLGGAPAVLVFAIFVFAAAALAALRLPVVGRRRRPTTRPGPVGPRPADSVDRLPDGEPSPWASADRDLVRLQPVAHPEVVLGLTTVSLLRGLSGFMVFLVAFGLRREHAGLWWYGLAVAAGGLGSLLALGLLSRLRRTLTEQQIILGSVWLVALGAAGAAAWGTVMAQVLLALMVGFATSLALPSFNAVAQRHVPLSAQGRAFARFATRQQLVWVLGALVPVIVTLAFPAGDVVMAAVAGAGGVFYVTSRRALRGRALPRDRQVPPRSRSASRSRPPVRHP
jgi:hypothetical protein